MSGAPPIPIYQGQDFYVPYFEVKLQDRPLGQDIVRDISQVTYKDNLEDVDNFELTIVNWDAETRTYKYSDGDLFDPGKRLELWMGYYGKDGLRLMITGEINSLRPSFPSSGQPTMVISGLNLLHTLRKKQESHTYERLKDGQIARQIADRLKIALHTDREAEAKEERFPYLFQDNKYDIVFLMERARRIGYDLFVEEIAAKGQASQPRLYFGPSVNVRAVTYRLVNGSSLGEFNPELTTAKQVSKVTVRGWDSVNKKAIEASATRGELKTKGVGARGGEPAIDHSFDQREEIIANRPIHSKPEAKTLALQTLERISKDMVKGTGSVVGLPDLRAGSVVMIEGLGTRFSGRYFVTSTTHTIGDGGYTTQFECRREELSDSAGPAR
jgi:phage protein D